VITLHSIRVRVYYEDTDAGGIVYYANYLRYFERARTDWLRAIGVSHRELARTEGLGLVVRDCAIQYLRPARLDDLLEVEVGLADPAADVGRASLRFAQRARLADAPDDRQGLLAAGSVRVACIDQRDGRPVALPRPIMNRLSEQLPARHASTGITPDGTEQQR
jgi:acyl-CoA thioester hydrolase